MSNIIYGNYNQEELDLEYDMRRRCPHFAETFASMEIHNKRVVSNYECLLDVSFGKSTGEKLDIWPGRGGAREMQGVLRHDTQCAGATARLGQWGIGEAWCRGKVNYTETGI